MPFWWVMTLCSVPRGSLSRLTSHCTGSLVKAGPCLLPAPPSPAQEALKKPFLNDHAGAAPSRKTTSVINASLVAKSVKNSPAMQETRDRSLGQEDLLEKKMAVHFLILAWRTPWTVEPSGLQSMGLQRVTHDLATKWLCFKHLLKQKTAEGRS